MTAVEPTPERLSVDFAEQKPPPSEEDMRKLAYASKVLLFETSLARPFHPSEIKWKPQVVKNNRCMAIAYIDARLVMDRLDEAVGVDGWRDDYKVLPDGSVVCSLTLMTPSGLFVTKCDVGSPSDQPDAGDRLKAAFSDSLKRAAIHWGIGRYLYRIPSTWVDYDPVAKRIPQPPKLPHWALPKKEKPEPAVYHDELPHDVPEKTADEKHHDAAVAVVETAKAANAEDAEKKRQAEAAAAATKARQAEFIDGRIKWWRDMIAGCDTSTQLTQLIKENLGDEPGISKQTVWEDILKSIKKIGWTWNSGNKQVMGAEKAQGY